MNRYSLRVTLAHQYADVLVEHVSPPCKYFAYCMEVSKEGVQHFHFYLQFECVRQTIINKLLALKRTYKIMLEGNAFYSLKKLKLRDGEDFPYAYLAYMSKDRPEGSLLPGNLPPDVLNKVVKEQEIYLKEYNKKCGKKGPNLLKMFTEQFEAQTWSDHATALDEFYAKSEFLYFTIIKYYKDNGKLIRWFYIMQLIETILTGNCDLVTAGHRERLNRLLPRRYQD